MGPGSAADTLTVGPLRDGSAGRVRERPVHRLAQELQLRFYRRMLRCWKVFEKATVVRHHVVVPKLRCADDGEERLDVIEQLNSCRGVVDSWGEG